MTTLDQTPEWQDLWSHQLLEIIQTYDRELSDRHKEEAARSKARQKRARHEQDQAMFDEVSKENAERIRQEVLRQGRLNFRLVQKQWKKKMFLFVVVLDSRAQTYS